MVQCRRLLYLLFYEVLSGKGAYDSSYKGLKGADYSSLQLVYKVFLEV